MLDVIERLIDKNDSKLVLCVLDGLGGLTVSGKTELEAAATPNLDILAQKSATGLHFPVEMGITPGSGSAHLGLFGYDPLQYEIGRGVLEALGLGLDITKHDIAIRGNFCTVEYQGETPIVLDRRAGRISTEENQRITKRIGEQISEIDGVRIKIASGLEHRFVLVLRFPQPLETGADAIGDTDPQAVGKSPYQPEALDSKAEQASDILTKFIEKAAAIIKDEEKANYFLLRGVSTHPKLRGYSEVYGLKSAVIVSYPMYRGVARLVGMDVLKVRGTGIGDEIDTLEREYQSYDFFFLHIKKTDSYGEDGNFEGKAGVIEEFDSLLPRITALNPDVLVITGDHSTPALMKSHSWHPVPLLLASRYVIGGLSGAFSERECIKGELGSFRAVNLMPLMLANSLRLKKFGA